MAALDKDTFDGWLVVMMKNIGEAKMRFPAEAPWLIKLETAVLSKSQDPTRKLQELGLTPGAAPGGDMSNPAAGGMPVPPGTFPPGGMGAPPPTMGGAPMPDPAMVAQLMGGGGPGGPPMGGPPMGPPPGPMGPPPPGPPPGPPMM